MISLKAVHDQLSKINTSKSQGPDGIPPWFLNRYASHLAPIIHDIFQSSVDSGQVPKAWNEANITAIFKKGNRAVTSNYRPISSTPVISKLLEYIIHSHIMKHLEQHHILTDHQHDFRAERTQQVIINGSASKQIKVTSGVPQRTALGPLLFLLYINDLPNNLISNVRLFADDCLLYQPVKSDNDISLLQMI